MYSLGPKLSHESNESMAKGLRNLCMELEFGGRTMGVKRSWQNA